MKRTRHGSSAHPSLSRLAVLIMLGSLLAVLLPLSAQASQSYRTRSGAKTRALAHVRSIQRGLTVQPPRKRAVAGKKKMALYNQYFLRTKRRQRASLAFKDGTILHMNQETDATLSAHITRLKKGEVDEVVSPGTDHRVQTATAIAGAIGTEFDVREVPAKLKVKTARKGKKAKKRVTKERARTVFTVAEGSLLVENKKGSVVVKADQQTTVIQGQAPQRPKHVDAAATIGWTNNLHPPKVHAENIALDANGGQVVAYSSQATSAFRAQVKTHRASSVTGRLQAAAGFAATNINDGLLTTGWMSAQGQTTNQWVKLRFKGTNAYAVTQVAIDPAATGGKSAADDLKGFQIRVSTTGTADSDFATVYSGTARQVTNPQTFGTVQLFTLPAPVPARYIELYALNNYGGKDGIAVAEFEAVGKSVAVTPPPPTATPTPKVTPTSTPTPTPRPTATPIPPTATPTPHGYSVTLKFQLKLQEPPGEEAGDDDKTVDVTLTGSVCNSDPWASAWNMTETYVFNDPSEQINQTQSNSFQQTFAHGAAIPYAGQTSQLGAFDLSLTETNPPQVQLHIHLDASVGEGNLDQTVSAPLQGLSSC